MKPRKIIIIDASTGVAHVIDDDSAAFGVPPDEFVAKWCDENHASYGNCQWMQFDGKIIVH